MKGIDRPENAPDDWQPSLLEHIRHAAIAIAFEERNKRPQLPTLNIQPEPWEIKTFGWTADQVEQVKRHRSLIRKYGLHQQSL